jgi:RNA polymerase sigma-70 factor (ECF subfamily)
MNSTSPSLLDRLRQPEDHEAWSRFVQLYTPLLHYWVRRTGFADHEADDLVQDVFAHLVTEMPRFDYVPGKTFRGWLRVVARNKWNEHRRRRRLDAKPISDVDLADHDATDPAELLATDEFQHLLYHRALELIQTDFPGNTWLAFQMVVVEGQSAEAVAAELGMTKGAVHAARFRVLTRLRAELAGLID